MNYVWLDWAVMCYQYIHKQIGLTFGRSLMYVPTARKTLPMSANKQEPSMSDYRCTQANLLYLRATTKK